MVDAGEHVATTLRREFCEEAMDMLRADESSREELLRKVDQWFAGGVEVRPRYPFSYEYCILVMHSSCYALLLVYCSMLVYCAMYSFNS